VVFYRGPRGQIALTGSTKREQHLLKHRERSADCGLLYTT
jgi:hypothetical protein